MDAPADVPADAAVEATAARRRREDARDATRKQIRGSSLLLSGRAITLGVNFAVQILIVRYLTKSDFGAYAYAMTMVSFGQSVITFGLDRAITRFIPIYEERAEYDKVFGTIVMVAGTILSLGVALVALTWGLAGVIDGTLTDDETTVSLLLILVFLAPVSALDSLQTGMFAVFSKPRAIFFRKYVLGPGFKLAVVLLVVLGGRSVYWLAGAGVVAGGVAVVIYAYLLYQELGKRGLLERFHWRTKEMPAREVFGFTVPLLSSDLLYTVMHTTDAALVGHYGGPTDVAALRVVGPLAHFNQTVLSSFSLLYTPLASRLYARGDREGINEVYWGTAVWTAVLSFPIFALTFSLAEPLTVTLYGQRYEDSGLYLMLLAFGSFVQAAFGFNGLTLKVFGLLRYIVTINLLAMVANLALNFALVPRFGPLGAAIATCSTLVVHNAFKQWGLRRCGVALFDWHYLRIYASIAAGAAGLLVLQLAASPPFAAGFAIAALVSLGVVAVNRRALRVAHVFPELMRFRLIRVLVGE